MKDSEFVGVAKVLKAAYSRDGFLESREQYDLWLMHLGKESVGRVLSAVANWIKRSAFPPTIADILSGIDEVKAQEKRERMEIMDLWEAIQYPDKTESAKKRFFEKVYSLPPTKRLAGARWLRTSADRAMEIGNPIPLEELILRETG